MDLPQLFEVRTMNQQQTGSKTEAILGVAKQFIFDKYNGYAYPDVPLDEDGNPEDYDPGCVDWISVVDLEVRDASYQEFEDGEHRVHVDVLLKWSSDEDDSDVEQTFEVFVVEEEGELYCLEDFERIY